MTILRLIGKGFCKMSKETKWMLATMLVFGILFGGILIWEIIQYKATPRVTYADTFVSKFEEINELAVVKTTYQGITEVRNEWLIDKLDEVGLMTYTADITTSVDLSNVKPIIDDEKHTIVVKIPQASEPEINIRKDSIEWIDVSKNTLEETKFTKKGLEQARKECEQKIDETGLMKTATENAKLVVESLFAALAQGDEPYKVEVKIAEKKK